MTTTLRQQIWELLGNLAEFGEQDSITDNILKLFEQKIDEKILNIDPAGMFWDDATAKRQVLEELKQELK